VSSPLSVALYVVAAAVLLTPLIGRVVARRRAPARAVDEPEREPVAP